MGVGGGWMGSQRWAIPSIRTQAAVHAVSSVSVY